MGVYGGVLRVFVFCFLPSDLHRKHIESVLGRPDLGQYQLCADDVAVRPHRFVKSVVGEQSKWEARRIFQTLARISGLYTLYFITY